MAVINLFQNNIIDPKELMKIHKDPNIRIIDGRWYIDDKKRGKLNLKRIISQAQFSLI